MLHALMLAAAAASPPGPTKPIRSMTFSFHMDGESYGGFDTIANHVQGGFDGTIHVDVMAVGPQKTLLLRMDQRVPLAHQMDFLPADCVVYPDGHVDFDPKLSQFSTPELTLARFLTRDFINPDLIDVRNHWGFQLKSNAVDIVTDYTIVKNQNGVLSIDETRDFKNTNSKTHTTGRLTYDASRTIPISIHEDSVMNGFGSETRMRLDYSLSSDSKAPPR